MRLPVVSATSKRLYRHVSQSVCPWNLKYSPELAEGSPFQARPFLDGKDAVTLATDILALDEQQFSAGFLKSPTTHVKFGGLLRKNELPPRVLRLAACAMTGSTTRVRVSTGAA